MSTSNTTHIARRKQHKGGKVLSLSILWASGGVVAVLAIVGIAAVLAGGATKKYAYDAVAVTSASRTLQPVSPKIVASDSSSFITDSVVDAGDYADVWAKLDKLAPAGASQEERRKAITAFLDGLDFEMTTMGGEILSKASGNPVSPSTLACYLNGYIPDKPYLKANCPAY